MRLTFRVFIVSFVYKMCYCQKGMCIKLCKSLNTLSIKNNKQIYVQELFQRFQPYAKHRTRPIFKYWYIIWKLPRSTPKWTVSPWEISDIFLKIHRFDILLLLGNGLTDLDEFQLQKNILLKLYLDIFGSHFCLLNFVAPIQTNLFLKPLRTIGIFGVFGMINIYLYIWQINL